MIPAFVHIIESPSDWDFLDGRTEGRSLCETLKLAQIPGWYSVATSKRAFLEALDARLRGAWDHYGAGLFPILHLSMHGNQDGVQLTDGTFVRWDELQEVLQPLNNALKGALLVCMSACHGISGIRMAMFEGDDYPFWGLVGHTSTALVADGAIAYAAFYHRLFKGASIDEAVTAMKIASGDDRYQWFRGAQLKDDWLRRMSAWRANELSGALAAYQADGQGSHG